MRKKNMKIIFTVLIVFILVVLCTFYGQKGSYSVDYKYLNLKSDTVCQININDNTCMNKLNALVYVNDVNSSKWAILIHGSGSSGTKYGSSRAGMFIEQGYNFIAPDLRGHGDTGGDSYYSYLESLDIYDWIKDLNENWNDTNRYGVNVAPETIIVLGTSLGGATTLQLATNPDIANANGVEPYTKNLTELNVKGFVDDCGFVSFYDIYNLNIGLEIESTSSAVLDNVLRGLMGETYNLYHSIGSKRGKYDLYENVFSNGRKFPSGSKILIIHDTMDSTVPYEHAQIVEKNVSPGILVYKYAPSGFGHAFFNDEYENLVTKFIKCVEDSSCTKIN